VPRALDLAAAGSPSSAAVVVIAAAAATAATWPPALALTLMRLQYKFSSFELQCFTLQGFHSYLAAAAAAAATGSATSCRPPAHYDWPAH